jgi:predicted nuclease with TOPRIM domain
MQPYLDKVFDEFRDLENKLNELRDFMENPEQWRTVSPDNQERMEMQANVMTLYLHILNNRIKTYSPTA